MPHVALYTTAFCPYCFMAKRLLHQKGVNYEEIDIGQNPERRQEMMEKSGGRHTVPQIFIGETHVGGCDDLHSLERAGQLDQLLDNSSTS